MFLLVLLNIVHLNAIQQEDFYNCHFNNDACNSTDCSVLKALQRSGFICDDFPYFTGGLQLQFIQYGTAWNEEMDSISQCSYNQSSSNISNTFCSQWQTLSIGHPNLNQTCICNYNNTTLQCSTWNCYSSQNIANDNYQLPTSQCECMQYTQNMAKQETCIKWTCLELYYPQYPNSISINETKDKSMVFNASYQCTSDKPDDTINQSVNNSFFCWEWSADKINQGI